MQYRVGVKRVLMVQACDDDWTRLETGLQAAGYSLLEVVPVSGKLSDRVESLRPDMVIAEADEPTPEVLDKLAGIDRSRACPVVMFTRRGSDRMVIAAMQSGVILHVVEALTPMLLHSLIEVAALFSLNQRLLQGELTSLQQTLSDHRYIEQAKCLLMEKQGLSEQEAYTSLRSSAMDRSQRLADVSRALLASHARKTGIRKDLPFKGL